MFERLKTVGKIASIPVLLSISGCGLYDMPETPERGPHDVKYGEVIDEYGTLPTLMRSSGALFGNQIGELNLGIRVKTTEGIYTFDINRRTDHTNLGSHTIYNLEPSIEERTDSTTGTMVSFPTRFYANNRFYELFSSDKLGILNPNDVMIEQAPQPIMPDSLGPTSGYFGVLNPR